MKAVCLKLLKLSCQNQSVDKVQLWPLTFYPKMYRYFPLTIMHLCMKYKSCMLKLLKLLCQNQSSVVTLTFDLKMYRYLTLTILHLCMKYESCTLKTTQVIVSEPKCWRTDRPTADRIPIGRPRSGGALNMLKCDYQGVTKLPWHCPILDIIM